MNLNATSLPLDRQHGLALAALGLPVSFERKDNDAVIGINEAAANIANIIANADPDKSRAEVFGKPPDNPDTYTQAKSQTFQALEYVLEAGEAAINIGQAR